MLEGKQISEYDDVSTAFDGVRFVLYGFDPDREEEVRSKLLEGGGVDVVNYGPDCNHVIVDKIVYDDPICVAARRDGKILVTGFWVDHSYDVGAPVDPASSVLYRPVRDLNGIPGAESLIICLTGYQGLDREDIMNMVALMGATFSKPLKATEVTHLICYKFQGEKYELAMKMNTMKLVNHRWLQDCLKAWELLPEDDYAKSGYELEMEVVAKDSEDETEDMAALDLKNKNIVSPLNTRLGSKSFHQSPGQIGTSRNTAYITAFESFSNVGCTSKDKATPRKETGFQKASCSRDLSNSSCARSPAKISSEAPANVPDAAEISEKFEQVVASAPGSTKNIIDGGLSSKSMKSSLPLRPERIEHKSGSPLSNVSKSGLSGGFNTPKKIDLYGTDSHGIRSPSKGSSKRQTVPRGSSRSPVLSHSPNPLIKSGSASKPMEMLVSRPSTDGSCRLAFEMSPNKGNNSLREDTGFLIPSEKIQDGTGSGGVKTPLKGALLNLDEEETYSSPSKKKMSLSRGGLKSSKLSRSPKILRGSGLDTKATDVLGSGSSVPASHQRAIDDHTNASSCLREDVGAINMLSEREEDEIGSAGTKTPLGGTSLHLNEEQTSNTPSTKKLTFSRSNTPSTKKLSRSRKTSMATKASEELVPGSLAHGSHQSAVDKSPPTNINRLLNEEIAPASKEAPVISALREDMQECNGQAPKRSRGRPKKQSLKSGTAGEGTHPSDPPDIEPPFPSTSAGIEKSVVQADVNSSKEDLVATKSNPLKKKMPARKTLGTKPSICKGKTARNKGFLSSLLQSEFSGRSNRAVATEDTTNAPTAEESVAVSPRANEDIPVDDETEAPEFEEPNDFDRGAKNSVEVEEPHLEKATPTRKEPSEKTTKTKKGANTKVKKNAEAKKSVCTQKPEVPESKSTENVAEEKVTGNKKRPLAKSKKNKSNDPTEEAKDETKSISSNKGTLIMAGKTSKRPSKKLKRSDDVEKENEPVTNEQPSASSDKGAATKSTSHRLKKPLNVSTDDHNTKIEPACFILSGHRLQRKEFQQVIKRLRGKVCRDSHSWSYQATHFIVPDPIRRTEKFFAAAASGSWILKTDYLTASTEAGRFVSEEPYEWHKKCLTEDGAINLEAPRKWRLLRERTGHGAFYGMRIIIYGECIAPPLDTLKRVVKAGDGTILATSPPYTRFLNSGVDFAIVSPGMPRVDLWVQDFLQNEIPCISADYLVEYVCKPGFSLDRHVQYNTHAWAKRSLENMINRVEESVEDPKTLEDNSVECQVCGKQDRGDEMLMCGDENGTVGCGIGTHINCLDPPLDEVPEEDWFCHDCTRKREAKSNRGSKKRTSKSKK